MKYNHISLTFILLLFYCVSDAAIYVVNTSGDWPDNDLMDGVCDTGLSGQTPICSLRAAVMEANASQGVDDTIALPNDIGTYLLSRIDEDDDAFKGDLDITDNVAIINGTPAGAIIDADFIDRAFHIHPNSQLTLQGITIINGLANTENTYQGGAVFIQNGELIADRVTFKNNVANQGGAINSIDGMVDLTHTYFQQNATSDSPNLARGSALYIQDSQVNIGNTTIAHNINPIANPQSVTISAESSAIYAGGSQADLYVYNSTIAHNYTGISFVGGNELDIIHSTIANNASYGLRSLSGEALLIERSLFAQNDVSCLIGTFNMGTLLENNGSTDSSCQFADVSNIENMPAPLHNGLNHWGGYAPTLMLYPNSQAIDSIIGCDADLLEDQRGANRPVDGNDDMFAFCDMGAIEYNPQTDDDIIFKNEFD